MTGQTVVGKVVNIGSQIALAWLLSREDFGVVSRVFSVTAFPALIYQIGIREVLVRRQSSMARWSSVAYWVSGTFGVLSALSMLAIAPIAVRFYYGTAAFSNPALAGEAKKLVLMIALVAAAAPATALANVALVKLQTELQFRSLAAITFAHAAGLSILSVVFAAIGCGAYSFVLPWPIVGIARFVILFRLSHSHLRLRPQIRRWKFLIGDGTLVLLARGFGTFVIVGDYLALGYFHTERTLGTYYFAYNLSMQTMILLAMNMEGVLFPALSKIGNDRVRQRQVFMKTVQALAIVGIPACLLQATLASPGIHAVFPQKWYPAIHVTEILSVGMAFRIAGWPTVSMLLAQGRYKALVAAVALSAVNFMTLVTLAAALSPERYAAEFVAGAVAIHFAIEAPAYLYIAIRPGGGRLSEVALAYAAPLLAGAVSALLGLAAAACIPASAPMWPWLRLAATLIVTSISYVILIRMIAPASWGILRDRFGGYLTPLFARLGGRSYRQG
jgi:O-antigen/teichoic acid export membrane protein